MSCLDCPDWRGVSSSAGVGTWGDLRGDAPSFLDFGERNRAFSTRQILDRFRTKPGFPLDSLVWQNDLDSLLARYRDTGYVFAQVADSEEEHKEEIGLRVTVIEGDRLRTGAIAFTGNRAFSDSYLRDRLKGPGAGFFSQRTLEADIEKLLSLYENTGYPFASITPGQFRTEGDRVDFLLQIDEGPRLRIAGITPRGLEFTRPHVVSREFRIRRGEFFDQKRIDRGIRRLRNSGLFRDVGEPVVLLAEEEGWCVVEVPLRETKGNRFSGLLGYDPGSQSREATITGELLLEANNLLGSGRKARLDWRKQTTTTLSLEAIYEEPWFLSRPVALRGQINHRIQDSTFAWTSGLISVLLQPSDLLEVRLGLGAERSVPQGSSGPVEDRSRKGKAIFGITRRTLDPPLNPDRGSEAVIEVELGLKEEFPPGESRRAFTVQKVGLDLTEIRPVVGHQAIALLGHARSLFSDESPVPSYELFTLGGWRSLRGYREEEFRGTKVASATAEYRFLVSDRGRFFVFLESGYASGEAGRGTRTVKPAYGFGFRLPSYLGTLGVDYGIAGGSNPAEGMVHVGLVNDF